MSGAGGSSIVLRLIATASLGWVLAGCSAAPIPSTCACTAPPAASGQKDIFRIPLVTGIYTADPAAHVFGDRLYVYTSHDRDTNKPDDSFGGQYDMTDYHVLSFADMHSAAVDLGEILNVKDVPWAEKQMWAPDAAFKNGTYYLYFPAKDRQGVFRIGVATSTSPAGPFVAQKEPIAGSFSIDPAVFVDDDGQAYMYFGGLWGGQLERWQSGTYDANAEPGGGDAGQNGTRPKGRQAVRRHAELRRSRQGGFDRRRWRPASVGRRSAGTSSKPPGSTSTTAPTTSRIPPASHSTWPMPRATARWGPSSSEGTF